MTKLIKEGPMDALINLDSRDFGAREEAPPGTLAVSAADQNVDKKMLEAGFKRMVAWERPDTKMVLTLWRKAGLAMPKKGMSKSPHWEEVYSYNADCILAGTELFACCGITALNSTSNSTDCCELAHIFISIKPPPNDEQKAPAIRIWEGKYLSRHPDGNILFNRRLRCWLRLPLGCKFQLHDTRLI